MKTAHILYATVEEHWQSVTYSYDEWVERCQGMVGPGGRHNSEDIVRTICAEKRRNVERGAEAEGIKVIARGDGAADGYLPCAMVPGEIRLQTEWAAMGAGQ